MPEAPLPDGVIVRSLTEHGDDRGSLFELYRDDWTPAGTFRQWNIVRSKAGVLRGVHVHPRHCDYLHVIEGEMLLGMHDLRPEDPAARSTCFITLRGDEPRAVFVPPGVCHGFWFPKFTTYVYGLSTGWSMNEEMGCRFDDQNLGLEWPTATPVLSARDAAPETDYAAMRAAWQASHSAGTM